MCSLDFFQKPRDDYSLFGRYFDLGNFKGIGCKGSSQEREESVKLLLWVFGCLTLFALTLIYFARKTLKTGQTHARMCDKLERAIVEHDEYCAKSGIRGRAETFEAACIEGYFLDIATMSAWLKVNNLESNIECVDRADFADLLPTGDQYLEIEDMRRAFNAIVRRLHETKKLPMELELDQLIPEPEQEEHGPVASTPHNLISGKMDATPGTSRQKTIDEGTPGAKDAPLIATTPPPEPKEAAAAAGGSARPGSASAETDKLLDKKKK